MKAFEIEDEISLTMVGDIGRHDASPMLIVYPEAVIYGPVKPEDVHFLVEEHLYKGRIATNLQAPARELTGRIAWITARKGTLPAEHASYSNVQGSLIRIASMIISSTMVTSSRKGPNRDDPCRCHH